MAHIANFSTLYKFRTNAQVTELSIDQREYLHFLANSEFICSARVIQLLRMLKVYYIWDSSVLKV